MKKIKFAYIDKYTRGQWSYQECEMESVEECIKFYGLDDDPDCYAYQILEVKDI